MTPVGTVRDGQELVDRLLAPPRLLTARRLPGGLLLEAELRRDTRPVPVPYLLGYSPSAAGGWRLTHAHAAARRPTVLDAGDYLFLSDRRPARSDVPHHHGRSLWRHRADAPRTPQQVLSVPGGVESYAATASTVLITCWAPSGATSLPATQEDQDGRTATLVRGDLWPRSRSRAGRAVLRLARLRPASGPKAETVPTLELLPVALGPDTELTRELALTPDGEHAAAGVVRFLRGGHRRFGLLLFRPDRPHLARVVWADGDLTEPVAAPDGSVFACVSERVATPGLGPRQEPVLVPVDGSDPRPLASHHPDWLRPGSWNGPDELLCLGERDGRRLLWRARLSAGTVEPVADLVGSVLTVTAAEGEALVVRSDIDLPPEVVSVPLADTGLSPGDPAPETARPIRPDHSGDSTALRGAAAGRRRRNPQPARPGPGGPTGRVLLAPAAALTPAGRVERLRYEAPDGSRWLSRLCLPPGLPENPLPLLVWCHGGPLLSWTDWSWRWNPWPFVAHGYAVLMPDPPLSLGYGQQAVDRGWGRWTTEVAPIAAAQVRAALAERPELDGRRLATMGGSFGGYLALALGTLLPGVRLVAGHAGWADFTAVARACDLHWHWLREYGPLGADAYARESLSLAGLPTDVKVLLSHGCEDPHVPVGEARALYRLLDARGVDVELMLLPEEEHAIRRPANVAAWYAWVLRACHARLDPPKRPDGTRRHEEAGAR
ncbi:S9 family peptidase [Streptacidiphilus melanogenes]|uniref:S9 family peptidase n=1 Tax=Streptacidiphilus melanogenes TaxID=411235 RepID=UPI0006945F58|nr:prolyl oligopeptidase family serine peptidase [Streptacidiphilus melanogenes]